MVSFARIRLVAAIAGGVNLLLLVCVFAAPFWRTTMVAGNVNIINNMYGYEGLWMECMNFQRQQTQCSQIGQMSGRQASGQRTSNTSYYQYGIYANLTAYRAMMIIALVSEMTAVCFSLAGMKCTKPLREGSGVKRWINILAGTFHFVAGVMTGVAVSWYAAEVVREYWSPFYQTTRIKYTLGACLFIGWISMATSVALGCVLTCCTCFNGPVDDTEYEWKPPITELEMAPYPVESVMMAPPYPDSDEWEDEADRYTSSKKSHRSHRSHKSHKSHRSHRSEKRSAWVDDYDYHRQSDRDDYRPKHDDGFV